VLLSMTGHGEARGQSDRLHLAAEVRSVNNRYLKLMLRAPEPYNLLESEVEKLARRFVRRGTLHVHLRVDRPQQAQDYRINTTALQSYIRQVRQACVTHPDYHPDPALLLGYVLALPGVAPEPGAAEFQVDQEWPLVERVLEEAMQKLQAMRREEGARMAQELSNYHGQIGRELDEVKRLAPAVVEGYRDRLLERVRALVTDARIPVEPPDLIREVSVFAERSDVAEEITRLASHLKQFEQIIRDESDGPGRKLEFVLQEMGREANTIGSKASDVTISRHVVEIKSTLEKARELIQNVE
jgi:uncharacterized protein (TIGR00255 family)